MRNIKKWVWAMRSMTGFGQAAFEKYGRRVVVSVRTLNQRHLDVTVKAPYIMSVFEDGIKKRVSERILRGKAEVCVLSESESGDEFTISVNKPLVAAYVMAAKDIYEEHHFNLADTNISLNTLMRLDDIMSVKKNEDENVAAELKEVLDNALSDALDSLVKARETEGAALQAQLLGICGVIEDGVSVIEKAAPVAAQNYKARLTKKINALISEVSAEWAEMRILTEVALFADKMSVDEEITRLRSHISSVREILGESGAIGRRLDFLIQEINREINTIGSKSNDADTIKIVVSLKNETEKMREQAQNIE